MEKTKNIKYKGKPKQGTVSGFADIGGTNTEKQLQLFQKNKPKSDWRRQKQIKILYSIVNRTWTYNPGGNGGDEVAEFTQKFTAPFGMVRHMDQLAKQERCPYNYQVLLNDVKEAFPLVSKETTLQPCLCGAPIQGIKDLGHSIGYTACIASIILSQLPLETYKSYLAEPAKVEDLMSHWDQIEANHKMIGKRY